MFERRYLSEACREGEAEAMVTPDWEARRANAFVALADGQLLSAYRLAAVLLGDPVEAQDAAEYGYARLRPAGWSATDLGTGRLYVAPGGADGQLPMSLSAVNYLVLAPSSNGIVAERALFEQHPSLDGWTAAMEQFWRSIGGEATLLRALPEARIYELAMPEPSGLSLVALVVDGTQPIAVTLHASGSDADAVHLEQSGALADFVTMVESVRQVPYDPGNVVPELASPGHGVQAP
jgi:hypothetical protein